MLCLWIKMPLMENIPVVIGVIIVDVLATRDSFQPNTDRRANYSLEQSEQVSIEIDTELRI